MRLDDERTVKFNCAATKPTKTTSSSKKETRLREHAPNPARRESVNRLLPDSGPRPRHMKKLAEEAHKQRERTNMKLESIDESLKRERRLVLPR